MTGERSITILTLVACVGVVGALTGCQAPTPPTGPTLARVTVDSPENIEGLWQATDTALRQYSLTPDRQDRSEGVIVTHPETTAAWFEFWRPQPSPAYLWWEANVSSVRRQATVTIHPATQPEYEVSVQIDRYRYSLEPRQVDNPAGALRLYSDVAPTVSGRMEKPSQTGQWLPLGRDASMEQAILTSILKRYAKHPVAASTSTQPAASDRPSPPKTAG